MTAPITTTRTEIKATQTDPDSAAAIDRLAASVARIETQLAALTGQVVRNTQQAALERALNKIKSMYPRYQLTIYDMQQSAAPRLLPMMKAVRLSFIISDCDDRRSMQVPGPMDVYVDFNGSTHIQKYNTYFPPQFPPGTEEYYQQIEMQGAILVNEALDGAKSIENGEQATRNSLQHSFQNGLKSIRPKN